MITQDSQAVLLLCGVLGPKDPDSPLAPREYQLLSNSLHGRGLRVGDLVNDESLVESVAGDPSHADRLIALLRRGVKLGLAMESWENQGIWVLTRTDADYPALLEKRLEASAPPVIFGVGPRSLLRKRAIAIVGSRDASPEALDRAADVAKGAVAWGMPVVSGGAKGVDERAMREAIESGGEGVAVLAGELAKTSRQSFERDAVLAGRMALLSSSHPTAPWVERNAFARNRLIYCLATQAVVITATRENGGGTWRGAAEALRRRWVPVFAVDDGSAGNASLIEAGASPWPPVFDPESLCVVPSAPDYTPAVERAEYIHDRPEASSKAQEDWMLAFDEPRTIRQAAQILSVDEKKLRALVRKAEKEELIAKHGRSGRSDLWLRAGSSGLQPGLF
ncbi:MAG TPA: DNA-processing protein DprA [Thermoanaerobaculia bacterium]|nr:DNA-processing protein DprA [Thermoanaerobaculia bacterium]